MFESSIKFWVYLKAKNYDDNTGWHCPALDLPQAAAIGFRHDAENVAEGDLKIEAGYIRFNTPPVPRKDLAVLIALPRKLVRLDGSVVAAVIVAVITAAGGFATARWGKVDSDAPAAASVCPPERAAVVSDANARFRRRFTTWDKPDKVIVSALVADPRDGLVSLADKLSHEVATCIP